jgi:hypothetical protein
LRHFSASASSGGFVPVLAAADGKLDATFQQHNQLLRVRQRSAPQAVVIAAWTTLARRQRCGGAPEPATDARGLTRASVVDATLHPAQDRLAIETTRCQEAHLFSRDLGSSAGVPNPAPDLARALDLAACSPATALRHSLGRQASSLRF